jgi:AcrR family transcriptional regulator
VYSAEQAFNCEEAAMEIDERSTAAKIRDAAIECYATEGIAGTTSRKVAALADVSPGSVINHFGSMDGLRQACDRHLITVTRDRKQQAMAAGPNLDILSALREGGQPHLMAYLAEVLTDNSPAVAELIDGMIADAEVYLSQGVETGMLQPSADPHGRAVILVLWNLGLLVMHHHLDRLLGADLTDPDFGSSPNIANYLTPILEIYGDGVFTPEFVANAREAMAAMADDPATTDSLREDAKGTSP